MKKVRKYKVAYCSDRYTENRDKQFLYWILAFTGSQWSVLSSAVCTCMPGLTEDKSGCMILYALKLIQFVVRDTSKDRITVV